MPPRSFEQSAHGVAANDARSALALAREGSHPPRPGTPLSGFETVDRHGRRLRESGHRPQHVPRLHHRLQDARRDRVVTRAYQRLWAGPTTLRRENPKSHLTGQVTRDSTFGAGDIRATLPRFTPAALSSNLDLVDRITAIAARLPATPGQVALAWLLARKPWIVPIPGTRRIERLDENLAAAELDLSEDDLEELTVASDSVDVQGDRYPPAMQAMVDRT